MNKNRQIWDRPWKYKEGVLVSIAILLLGFILEFSTGGKGVIQLLQYPNNIFFGIGIIILLFALSFFRKKSAIVEWLGSVPAAICSIGLLLFVSLLMGLTLQYDNTAPEIIKKLGLSHVVSSWPYLLSNLFLLLSLGLTTIKNIVSFRWNKLGFVVSHIGLWVVLFGANFGSIQLERLQMTVREGYMTDIAIDRTTNQNITMPFAIGLVDFILEEYNPKISLVYNQTGKLYMDNKRHEITVDSAIVGHLEDWEIVIKEYIYTSSKAGDKYYFMNETGAAPSAFISAKNSNGELVEGWVSCGSFNQQFEALKLNNKFSIVMLFPEPKEFTSIIEILKKDEKPQRIELQVNKPFVIDDWKLYQMSYDSDLGKWSDTSVIELIRDPWLKIVYTGIFLMLAGALYMFWMGSRKNNETKN